jgi:crotonobetainyl-CoA:carnitine CoA-transferase CaiB-like acyl-CoA transferase
MFDELADGPGPVWLNASAFGSRGPHSTWSAHGINLFHAGGEGYLMPGGLTFAAYAEREPIKGPRYLGEFGEGVVIAIGALIGMLLRDQSPAPLFIDVSGQEALLQLLRVDFSLHADEGQHVSRAMRSLGAGGLLPAKDGYVEILPLEERMWEALVAFIGQPEWSTLPGFQGVQARRGVGNAIVELLADWTVTKSRGELYHDGQARGIAVGSVMTPAEVLESPQLAYREFFVPIEHPYAGTLRYPRIPVTATPALQPILCGAPLLGQDNVAVFEALGYSRREIVALYEAGII